MTMQSTIQGTYRGSVKLGQASTTRRGWQWPLPMNSVVAVLDQSTAPDLLRNLALESYTVDVEAVSGPAGAAAIHAAFERQGIFERLVSHLNGEDDVVGLLEAEAAAGKSVLLFRVHPEHIPALLATLHRFLPDFVETNGRWIRSSISNAAFARAAA